MQVILPEILEILRVFGIEVSSGSFDFTTDSKDEDRIIPHCLSSNIKNFANVTRAVVAHGTVCHASEDMKEVLEGAEKVQQQGQSEFSHSLRARSASSV